jgi:hypothetical protein
MRQHDAEFIRVVIAVFVTLREACRRRWGVMEVIAAAQRIQARAFFSRPVFSSLNASKLTHFNYIL